MNLVHRDVTVQTLVRNASKVIYARPDLLLRRFASIGFQLIFQIHPKSIDILFLAQFPVPNRRTRWVDNIGETLQETPTRQGRLCQKFFTGVALESIERSVKHFE
jgi:hypothetical protein